MARPLRLEFAGALYHVTSRGDRREDIFVDDVDRTLWLHTLGQCCRRFNWLVHSWCQMSNHYHLVIETVEGNLSAGMRQLNGVYTQSFNRRHQRVGHVFQGRYKAILVERDTYFLELMRYVVLNPVRAKMVKRPGQWLWSAYGQLMGDQAAPEWLAARAGLAQFGSPRATLRQQREAFEKFVIEGIERPSIWEGLKGQVFLGSDAFVEAMQEKIESEGKATQREIPRAQRRAQAKAITFYKDSFDDRNLGMCAAYATGDYTLAQIADTFGVHYATVSRALRDGD